MNKGYNISRRNFLKTSSLMGAGALMPFGRSRAGVFLKGMIPEEQIIPGRSYWFPSTCNDCPAGCGVKVRVREGNAVKIEGNEKHPINHGGLCARAQSALQALYSPSRIRSPLVRNANGVLEPAGWEKVADLLTSRIEELAGNTSHKAVIASRQISGGMLAMLKECVANSPRSEYIVHETLEYAAMAAANRLCFGVEEVPTYKLGLARTIVSFGADLFETWLSPVSNAHGFAESRKNAGTMSRLIQIESHLSLTGANADDRYVVPPGAETLTVLAIASAMLAGVSPLPLDELNVWREALKPFSMKRARDASRLPEEAIENIAGRLKTQTPSLAVAGGPSCRGANATSLQIAVNLINTIAGSYGRTITFDRTENAPLSPYTRTLALVEEMEKDRIGALVVHDTNLELATPEPERLRIALKRVPLKIQLATVRDVSTERFDIVLPVHHWLERWDLLEPRSGLHSLQQPTISPWCDSRHPGQVLSDIFTIWNGDSGEAPADYEEFLRDTWEQIRRQETSSDNFADFWRGVLSEGGYWSEPTARTTRLDPEAAKAIAYTVSETADTHRHVLLPIATIRHGDGRQTGRPWLNELPDAVTTIVWDSPLLISPATAKEWKCRSGDSVELICGDGKLIRSRVHVQPGTSDAVVAAPIGFPSRDHIEYNFAESAHPFHRLAGEPDKQSGALIWTDAAIAFNNVVGRTKLARMQTHNRQDGRGIVRILSTDSVDKKAIEEYDEPDFHKYDLYPKHQHPIHDWTMIIDLAACIGCGACAVACHSENNVPIVGKDECLLGRELSWLRIERFLEKGRIVFLPMLCQQCEHAPCETVCPVYASVHSSEGLNVQVYNRCVGTRYCANNCPYKVRRFNWYTYKIEPPLDRQLNPDISLRTRGMMEKCTFCVQRIREHKEIIKDEGRSLHDGEIVTACAQSCPTGAITFGDLNDSESAVSDLLRDPRGYTIFSKLNTQPSVVYLKRIYHGDSKLVKDL